MFLRREKTEEDPQDLIARREYKKAISICRNRLSKEPKDVSLRLNLADALLQDKQLDPALKEYKKLAGTWRELY